MSPKKRRSFFRKPGKRRYRRLFILAVEGSITERQYFNRFNGPNSTIRISCLKGKHHSSPNQVLRRMESHLRDEELRKDDQAWLVVDKDQWTDRQLKELLDWANTNDNFGLALTNPKFELWILFHFEDCKGPLSSKNCLEKLERHLPRYDKSIDIRLINDAMVKMAISRAKERDRPPCRDWPRTTGTTVYRLAEAILKAN